MYVYPSCQLSCEAFSYNGDAWGMGYVSLLTYFLLSGVQILNLLQLFSKQI